VHQARVALTAATRPITAPVELPVAFVVVPRQQAAAVSRAATQGSPTAAVTAAAPAPQATLAGFPGLQDAIINGYNLVIPWVDYGVNLAQYAVGWIPVASFFAPQMGIFYYDLIRPIVTSAVFNLAYFIGGSVGLVQGVSNVINDSISAGIGFVNAEINWALSFLPPLPPFPLAAAQTTTLKTAEITAEPTAEAADGAAVVEKHEPSVATSVEPAAKAPADSAKPAAPTTAKPAEWSPSGHQDRGRHQERWLCATGVKVRVADALSAESSPAREEGLSARVDVAPQQEHRRRRPQRDEDQRRELHDACAAEHDVTARPAQRQHGHRHQPGPQRHRCHPGRRSPLQRRPHQGSVDQSADQGTDGDGDRADVERKE
jgi:hypothetical protein